MAAEVRARPRARPAPGRVAGGTLAAVDLGSNSFHLIVARLDDGHLDVIDRLREPVRLAAGLERERRLGPEAIARGLACLERFGQRLRGLPPGAVRAVGTNTLRSAHDAEDFRRRAEQALGHRIEVIAGREEARLIYLGVAHGLAGDRSRRLVIDIGGGSTELIVGEGFEALHRESLYMGCVSSTERFFPGGLIDKPAMRRAELAARVELEPVEARFRAARWSAVVGSSGTVRAVKAVALASGWTERGITRSALRKVRRAVLGARRAEDLRLPGLKPERRAVFPGGVAVLSAAFEALGIERMDVSPMALREGLLYDLVGRLRHEDVRDVTVRRMAARYRTEVAQAARVERTALALFDRVRAAWSLDPEAHREMLGWAARLHEVGLAVSHSQYHKHGAYIVGNADLAGFSRQEQALLASLVRGHRRKFPEAVFAALASPLPPVARRLAVLLRLAVVLHRARAGAAAPGIDATGLARGLRLRFPPGWLEAHPLTRADLEEEVRYLSASGFELVVDSSD